MSTGQSDDRPLSERVDLEILEIDDVAIGPIVL